MADTVHSMKLAKIEEKVDSLEDSTKMLRKEIYGEGDEQGLKGSLAEISQSAKAGT